MILSARPYMSPPITVITQRDGRCHSEGFQREELQSAPVISSFKASAADNDEPPSSRICALQFQFSCINLFDLCAEVSL